MCTYLRRSIEYCELSKLHFGEPSWQHDKCYADFKHKKYKEKDKQGFLKKLFTFFANEMIHAQNTAE